LNADLENLKKLKMGYSEEILMENHKIT